MDHVAIPTKLGIPHAHKGQVATREEYAAFTLPWYHLLSIHNSLPPDYPDLNFTGPVQFHNRRLREKTDLINMRPDLDAVAEHYALKKLEAEQAVVRETWQRVIDHRDHERKKLQVGSVEVEGCGATVKAMIRVDVIPPYCTSTSYTCAVRYVAGEGPPTDGAASESRTGMPKGAGSDKTECILGWVSASVGAWNKIFVIDTTLFRRLLNKIIKRLMNANLLQSIRLSSQHEEEVLAEVIFGP